MLETPPDTLKGKVQFDAAVGAATKRLRILVAAFERQPKDIDRHLHQRTGLNGIELVVPHPREVATEIRQPASGKPVIDVTNRMAPTENGLDMDTTSSNAEDLASLLPASPVVKAFNTLFASNQADPTADGVQLDGFVAADDETAKATVLELVESIGLNPVDVGPLKRARQLEGLAFLNITLNAENGGAWQSGWKLVGAPETVSAETTERGGAK